MNSRLSVFRSLTIRFRVDIGKFECACKEDNQDNDCDYSLVCFVCANEGEGLRFSGHNFRPWQPLDASFTCFAMTLMNIEAADEKDHPYSRKHVWSW